MTIQPIPTRYKGITFRSRLEARWAVFFDALRLRWSYEPEGYQMPDGSRYLPDFYLHDLNGGQFVEVKPIGGDFTKAKAFSDASDRSIMLAEGEPDFRVYLFWHRRARERIDASDLAAYGTVFPPEPYEGDPCSFSDRYLPGGSRGDECRVFAYPGFENADGTIDDSYIGDTVRAAVYAARDARFGT